MVPGTRALRNRPFRLLWLGQTVSQLGDAAYALVFIFMADRVTRDPSFVGLVAAAQALPFLVVSPLAGILADKVDRRSVMVASDLASAVVLAFFFALLKAVPEPPRWAMLLVPALLSSLNALFYPARGAAIPRLVPAEDLLDANALASATMNLMHTVGLALSAFVLAQIERADPHAFFQTAVLVNASTFVVSSGFLLALPKIPPEPAARTGASVLEDLRHGLGVVTGNPVLSRYFLVLLVVNTFVAGFLVVYTATNRAWFGGAFQTLAVIEISFMVSMVAGSLLVARACFARVGLAYTVSTALVGLTIALMAVPQYALYVAMNVVAGLLVPFISVPMVTYMNLSVPDEVRGRVNAVAAIASAGTQPVGAAFSGVALPAVGLVGMYLAMGFGMVGAGLLGLAHRPTREARMPTPDAPSPCQDNRDGA